MGEERKENLIINLEVGFLGNGVQKEIKSKMRENLILLKTKYKNIYQKK